MLWLVAAAYGHSPHDVCAAVARQADGTVLAGARSDLIRFETDGTLAAHLAAPEPAICLAALGTGAWLLVSETGQAWRSTDDGATWERLSQAAEACAQEADAALLGGASGTFRVGPATLDALGGTAVVAVAPGPDGALGLDADGALVSIEQDGAVLDAGPWQALASDGQDVLLADALGVFRWDGAAMAVGGPTDVRVLAVGPEAWLAAGAAGGIWETRDGGAQWVEEDAGLEPHEAGSGSPKDGVYWDALRIDGLGWLAAAWEGLYVRDPIESRWVQRETYTVPMVRGLQWLDDGTLLIAPYGAGLARGTPGALDWEDAGVSLGWPWVRTVLATEGGAGRWFVSAGSHVFSSDDAGGAWRAAITGSAIDGDAVGVGPDWPADPTVWAGAQDAEGNGLALYSVDGGTSWDALPLEGCTAKPEVVRVDADGTWMACGSGVWALAADAATRLPLPSTATTSVAAIERDGDALLIAGAGGVWKYLDGASERRLEGRVLAFAALPDGTHTDAARYVVAFDDGLATWDGVGAPVPLGWPEDDIVESLSLSPDGGWAVGTRRGAFVSGDGGRTWLLATDADRYDDRDGTFWYVDGWTEEDAPAAKAGAAVRGGPGAVAEWRLEATALTLRAQGDGALRVTCDDGEPEDIRLVGPGWKTVWSAALARAQHVVRIEVRSGSILLDGGTRWRSEGAQPALDEPAPDAPSEPSEGCACGMAVPPAWPPAALLLPALLLLRRRKEGPSRSPTVERRAVGPPSIGRSAPLPPLTPPRR